LISGPWAARKLLKWAWRGARVRLAGINALATASARGPDRRTIPTPPRPSAVAMATIVSVSGWVMAGVYGLSALNRKARREGRAFRSGAGPDHSFSILRVISHCWLMDNRLLVSQYSTRPAGNQRKNTVNTTGIHFMTSAWHGSGGVGFRRIWNHIETPISSGRINQGSISDRSWIQPKNGAWRSSTDSSST